MNQSRYSGATEWLHPAEEQEGLKRYVETLRERAWTIGAAIAVTFGIAVLYVLTATKTYEATAQMLVTPISGNDPVLTSLGLLRESSDPTRDVQTASQLIANVNVAARAATRLHTKEAPEALLREVNAEPVANSNIVAVIATSTSPQRAQELANAFAEAAVEERTALMHEQIESRLPRLEAIAGTKGTTGVPAEAGVLSVSGQIAELKALKVGPDPTMRLQTRAALPQGQASPQTTLSIFAGLIAGLILGIGGAFALQALDPRLRREAQLRRSYRLPVLARIPKAHRGTTHGPLTPGTVSPLISEAYRTLRTTLAGSPRRLNVAGGKVVLITGSSPSEGKTTSAVNLAASLAQMGRRVILIESDLRRPVLGKLLGIPRDHPGVVNVLIGAKDLEPALARPEKYGANLEVLQAEPEYREGWITDLFSTPTAAEMIQRAREIADYVIIDSPPINEVADALPLCAAADDVLLVVRLGRTRMDKLHELGELLAENEIRPSGFIVVGTPRPPRREYHYTYASTTGRTSDASDKILRETRG